MTSRTRSAFLSANLGLVGFSSEHAVFQAAKEMVENSLDARAQCIDILVTQYAAGDGAEGGGGKSARASAAAPPPRLSALRALYRISVADDGGGMAPTALRELGSIFGTTKAAAAEAPPSAAAEAPPPTATFGRFGVGLKAAILYAHAAGLESDGDDDAEADDDDGEGGGRGGGVRAAQLPFSTPVDWLCSRNGASGGGTSADRAAPLKGAASSLGAGVGDDDDDDETDVESSLSSPLSSPLPSSPDETAPPPPPPPLPPLSHRICPLFVASSREGDARVHTARVGIDHSTDEAIVTAEASERCDVRRSGTCVVLQLVAQGLLVPSFAGAEAAGSSSAKAKSELPSASLTLLIAYATRLRLLNPALRLRLRFCLCVHDRRARHQPQQTTLYDDSGAAATGSDNGEELGGASLHASAAAASAPPSAVLPACQRPPQQLESDRLATLAQLRASCGADVLFATMHSTEALTWTASTPSFAQSTSAPSSARLSSGAEGESVAAAVIAKVSAKKRTRTVRDAPAGDSHAPAGADTMRIGGDLHAPVLQRVRVNCYAIISPVIPAQLAAQRPQSAWTSSSLREEGKQMPGAGAAQQAARGPDGESCIAGVGSVEGFLVPASLRAASETLFEAPSQPQASQLLAQPRLLSQPPFSTGSLSSSPPAQLLLSQTQGAPADDAWAFAAETGHDLLGVAASAPPPPPPSPSAPSLLGDGAMGVERVEQRASSHHFAPPTAVSSKDPGTGGGAFDFAADVPLPQLPSASAAGADPSSRAMALANEAELRRWCQVANRRNNRRAIVHLLRFVGGVPLIESGGACEIARSTWRGVNWGEIGVVLTPILFQGSGGAGALGGRQPSGPGGARAVAASIQQYPPAQQAPAAPLLPRAPSVGPLAAPSAAAPAGAQPLRRQLPPRPPPSPLTSALSLASPALYADDGCAAVAASASTADDALIIPFGSLRLFVDVRFEGVSDGDSTSTNSIPFADLAKTHLTAPLAPASRAARFEDGEEEESSPQPLGHVISTTIQTALALLKVNCGGREGLLRSCEESETVMLQKVFLPSIAADLTAIARLSAGLEATAAPSSSLPLSGSGRGGGAGGAAGPSSAFSDLLISAAAGGASDFETLQARLLDTLTTITRDSIFVTNSKASGFLGRTRGQHAPVHLPEADEDDAEEEGDSFSAGPAASQSSFAAAADYAAAAAPAEALSPPPRKSHGAPPPIDPFEEAEEAVLLQARISESVGAQARAHKFLRPAAAGMPHDMLPYASAATTDGSLPPRTQLSRRSAKLSRGGAEEEMRGGDGARIESRRHNIAGIGASASFDFALDFDGERGATAGRREQVEGEKREVAARRIDADHIAVAAPAGARGIGGGGRGAGGKRAAAAAPAAALQLPSGWGGGGNVIAGFDARGVIGSSTRSFEWCHASGGAGESNGQQQILFPDMDEGAEGEGDEDF